MTINNWFLFFLSIPKLLVKKNNCTNRKRLTDLENTFMVAGVGALWEGYVYIAIFKMDIQQKPTA